MNKSKKGGEIIDVTIEKIVPNGYGLGFAEGLTVLVSLAAAGDRLRVKIIQKKGRTAFAEIEEVLAPSPDRVAPPCPYFGVGKCGGCDFQQMNYEAQLRAKVGIVRDSLTRIGKIDFAREIEVVGSPKPFAYRSRAQWHLDTRRQRIGYFRRNSHSVIDVETCPIVTEELQETLTELRAEIEWESFWAEKVEIEAASAGGKVSVYSSEIVEPTAEIAYELDENRYFYDARSFFQGNLSLVPQLVETALGGASGRSALDLYCGVGLFTLPLARRFERVRGVEANDRAIQSARRNIEHARLENAEVFSDAVGDWLTENAEQTAGVDFILLDPPRTGAERETVERILEIRPSEISYVSCDPSTLARDLRLLCVEGVYEISSITVLDLFPQTHHVETVVRLQLKP